MRILSVDYSGKDLNYIIVADVEEKTNVILPCASSHITKKEFANLVIDIYKDLNCRKFICEDRELIKLIREVCDERYN